MSNVFSIALSGMNAATKRFANAVSNMVNVSSTGKISAGTQEKTTSYIPTDVVTVSSDVGGNTFGVMTQTVKRDPSSVPAYDPSSPNANDQGLIAAPNVDIAAEILQTKLAEIAYQASAKVIEAEKKNEDTLLNSVV